MTLAPDDPRHGTPNGYTNHGCRCAACRAAKATYMRNYYLRTKGPIHGPPEPPRTAIPRGLIRTDRPYCPRCGNTHTHWPGCPLTSLGPPGTIPKTPYGGGWISRAQK